MAQNGAGKLGKEALDQVEPGAVRGCECELETTRGSSGEPSFRLLGDVRGMIVEDQLDRGMSRIGGIEKLEKFDKLTAAMAVPDQGKVYSASTWPGCGPVYRGLPATS